MGRTGRRFSEELKRQVIAEVLSGQSQAVVARKHNLSKNTIGLWLKAYRSGRLGGEATAGADLQQLLARMRAQEERIAQLERLLGKKEAELDLLKKLEGFEAEQNSGNPSIFSGSGLDLNPLYRGKKRAR